jgi:hypothetical protein
MPAATIAAAIEAIASEGIDQGGGAG